MASSTAIRPRHPRYPWAVRGDVNAFFGLMLDNIGDMILMASLLVTGFGMPSGFVLTKMIPGTAVGVMVGDLIYSALAFRLARRSGRSDVTAMPLGLDTPSTFGAVYLIIGPAFLAATRRGLEPTAAARHAWYLGIAMILASGLFKLACSLISGWVRRIIPHRLARLADVDITGYHQLPAPARHRLAADRGIRLAGGHPGDLDGAGGCRGTSRGPWPPWPSARRSITACTSAGSGRAWLPKGESRDRDCGSCSRCRLETG